METIDNEVWLLYPDGRLISMNRVAAPTIVGAGEAVEVPPERVRREGGAFMLAPDADADAAPADDRAAPEAEAATAGPPATASQRPPVGRTRA